MIISRKSPRTGVVTELELAVTPAQLLEWQEGALIQDAMPDLNADEREFVKTGFTPEDWEHIARKVVLHTIENGGDL
tara:strand:+ start:6490 stop:6720 length:231 start_codon:yes stop_codon:yes gene_type:complete